MPSVGAAVVSEGKSCRFNYKEKSAECEKRLEKDMFAVLKSHRQSTSLLYFEERAKGKAPKRVWPKEYVLINQETNCPADAMPEAMVYIIFARMDYKLKNKDGATVMEFTRPQVHILKLDIYGISTRSLC